MFLSIIPAILYLFMYFGLRHFLVMEFHSFSWGWVRHDNYNVRYYIKIESISIIWICCYS